MTTGCAAMPTSGLLGFINPRQMCTALLSPLGALGQGAELVALRVDAARPGSVAHRPLPAVGDHAFVVHPDELPDQLLPAR